MECCEDAIPTDRSGAYHKGLRQVIARLPSLLLAPPNEPDEKRDQEQDGISKR
jgi:hypothetical protein